MVSSRGIALIITLLAMCLFSALGLGLVLASALDRLTSTNHRYAVETLHAAEAALELAVRDLSVIPDWTNVLDGSQRSVLADGPPGGLRAAPGGAEIDLSVLTNQLTCGRPTTCSNAQRRAHSDARPWGDNNPWWRLFLYTDIATVGSPPGSLPRAYVVVWIGDDPAEADEDPAVDGGSPTGEGRDAVRVWAEAYGPSGTRRAIEAVLARRCDPDGACQPGIRVQSWRILAPALP